MEAEVEVGGRSWRGHRRGVHSLDFAIEGEELRADNDKTPTQEEVFLSGVGSVALGGVRRRKERGKTF
jgi:hypothetical protein